MKIMKSECPQLRPSFVTPNNTLLKVQIQSSADISQYVRYFWAICGDNLSYYECFFVLFLNRANNTIGWMKVSQGGMSGTVADPRIILREALQHGATSIILTHNHPSGSIKPSSADKDLTQKIKQAALYHDIRVLDHIIITEDQYSYYSFADEGDL